MSGGGGFVIRVKVLNCGRQFAAFVAQEELEREHQEKEAGARACVILFP